jgi:hypothetical protein
VGSTGGKGKRSRAYGMFAALVAGLLATELWFQWLLPTAVMAADVHRPAAAEVSEPEPSEAEQNEKGSAEPAQAASDVVTVNVVAAPPAAPERPAQPPAPESPRPEDLDPAWKAAKVTSTPSELGDMGPSLTLGLDAARRSDMAFCFRQLEQQEAEAGAPQPPHRRAGLVQLYVQTRENAVDVVDARVSNPGNLPPQVLDCCREVLRGLEVGVFFAEPGKRFRYLVEIEE